MKIAILIFLISVGVSAFDNCSGQVVRDGTYEGLEDMDNYTGIQKWKCYHLTHLTIMGDSVIAEQSPIAIHRHDTSWSSSDGGFYYYNGKITVNGAAFTIRLIRTKYDYCAISVDSAGNVKSKQKELTGEMRGDSMMIGGHYYRRVNEGLEIGNQIAVYDRAGLLQPWTSWRDAVEREMQWYLNCPVTHGYPNFVWMTFMDGNYQPDPHRNDFIPAMQNGMGIVSYLKYYVYDNRRNAKVLEWAKYMGDYLIKESNTPDEGRYPKFTRSTGVACRFPQPADCGTQADRPFEVEPDKGALAGYALVLLYKETKEEKYLDQALHNATVLVANMGEGDSSRSPWPFRVDYRTGEGRGQVSGDMVYILQLLDVLRDMGHSEFDGPRLRLWTWIVNEQLPSLLKDGALWQNFFEDHDEANDRTAWAPLNLARYLIEKKNALDSNWQRHSHDLIEFVIRNFTSIYFGVPVCGEQDHDKESWGGVLSTYGSVLAMYTTATGSDEYKLLAVQALDMGTYALNTDGCPCDIAGSKPCRGGWQEDAHTDKIHNFLDAIEAVKAWIIPFAGLSPGWPMRP